MKRKITLMSRKEIQQIMCQLLHIWSSIFCDSYDRLANDDSKMVTCTVSIREMIRHIISYTHIIQINVVKESKKWGSNFSLRSKFGLSTSFDMKYLSSLAQNVSFQTISIFPLTKNTLVSYTGKKFLNEILNMLTR